MFSQSIYGGNSRKKLFDISGLKNNAKKKRFTPKHLKEFQLYEVTFFH